MKALALLAALVALPASAADEWILTAPTPRALSGERFEVLLIAPPGMRPPDEITLRIKAGALEISVPAQALAPAAGERRSYIATMPALTGPVSVRLAEESSNELGLMVARRDAFVSDTPPESEPPLSENEPMYFVVGWRDGTSARFQLSFKYRLFDYGSGFGRERPWLAGFYFAYTQSSLWDLSSESAPFRDTSYLPSFFWRWERSDHRTWVDAARVGVEHESNGSEGPRSRSVNMLYVRPEWRFKLDEGQLEFTPRVNAYFDKDENPDIARYRGYVDWRVRYEHSSTWFFTTTARYGSAGTGSVRVDVSRRLRDLKLGPVSGYFHAQYFNGYGEDIVDYNVRRKSQLRIGVAIVP